MKKLLLAIFLVITVSVAIMPSKSMNLIKKIIPASLLINNQNSKASTNQSAKQIGDFEFKMIYESAQKRLFLANNKMPNNTQIIEAEKLLCYELRISHQTSQDILKIEHEFPFEERVMFFASDMQKDISMIIGKDTMPCIIYHFERNFGVAPYLSIHIGFESPKHWKKHPHHLIIEDNYFHIGQIHLENNLKLKN